MGHPLTGELSARDVNITGTFRVEVEDWGRTDEEVADNIEPLLEQVLPIGITVTELGDVRVRNFTLSDDDESASFLVYFDAELSGFEFTHTDITGSVDKQWEANLLSVDRELEFDLTKQVVTAIADACLVHGFNAGISADSIRHIDGTAEFVGTDEPGDHIEEDIPFSRSYRR
mgnify:CR=1 FL=1